MIKHARVATVSELPVPVKNEIIKLAVGHNVTRQVTAISGSLDTTVDHMPRLSK